MIEAKDLRIGNWINWNTGNKHGNIIPVQVDPYHMIGIVNGDVKNYYPIELTPDILEKAGFEKFEPMFASGPVFSLKDDMDENFTIVNERENYWLAHREYNPGMEESEYIEIGSAFQYVHQLQNLYYTLTGQELIVDF